MRRLAGRAALVFAAAFATAPAAGCCAIFCPPKPVKGPARLHRDAPRDTIAYLVDAIRRRSPNEIFETLHPAFVKASGDYSLADFAAGFDFYYDDFSADADRLDKAAFGAPVVDQGITWVKVTSGASGADIGFVNVPGVTVAVDDEFFPEIATKTKRIATFARIEGDTLVIDGPIPLGGAGSAVAGSAVKRIEFANNWLVYDIRNTDGIRLTDVLKNSSGALQKKAKP